MIINRYQRGAETIEFMLTLLLFMFVFFMIVDFAVVTYDRGTINNSARDGSRQASLFWVDPVCFDPETPLENQRFKPDMVTSLVTWVEQNLMIDPARAGLNATLQVNSANINIDASCSNGIDDVVVTESDIVAVNITYPHQYIGLSSFFSSPAPTLNTVSSAGVE